MDANTLTTVSWILAALGSVITAIIAGINLYKIQTIHVLLNSRLTALLQATHAVGLAEGKEIANGPKQ